MNSPKLPPKTSGFVWHVGRVLLKARQWWILAGFILVGAIAGVVLPRLDVALDAAGALLPWANVVVIVGGVVAALAVLADKVADAHSKKLDSLNEVTDRTALGSAAAALAVFADEAANVAFAEKPEVRAERLRNLRTVLVTTVSSMIPAEDIRATYYQVSGARGRRVLDEPVSRGRLDRSTTVWNEAEAPQHSVWTVLDRPDTEAHVVRAPDPDHGVSWDDKPYKAFISVPVAAGPVCFGMLSVNAPNSSDLTEADLVLVVTAARIFAAALALETSRNDPKGWKSR